MLASATISISWTKSQALKMSADSCSSRASVVVDAAGCDTERSVGGFPRPGGKCRTLTHEPNEGLDRRVRYRISHCSIVCRLICSYKTSVAGPRQDTQTRGAETRATSKMRDRQGEEVRVVEENRSNGGRRSRGISRRIMTMTSGGTFAMIASCVSLSTC